jgi:hypothetical protein
MDAWRRSIREKKALLDSVGPCQGTSGSKGESLMAVPVILGLKLLCVIPSNQGGYPSWPLGLLEPTAGRADEHVNPCTSSQKVSVLEARRPSAAQEDGQSS